MMFVIDPDGVFRCLHSEILDLGILGRLEVRRASHVEHNGTCWSVNLTDGRFLGEFARRSEALDAEIEFLESEMIG